MHDTLSYRIINHLKKLPQFQPVVGEECVDVRTGVCVTLPPDVGDADEGFLQLHFPGGKMVYVIGLLYAEVQIVEACRYWVDADKRTGKLSDCIQQQLEHFKLKVG